MASSKRGQGLQIIARPARKHKGQMCPGIVSGDWDKVLVSIRATIPIKQDGCTDFVLCNYYCALLAVQIEFAIGTNLVCMNH
jgi:hypothetical protein